MRVAEKCKKFTDHRFETFPSDARFAYCVCGAIKRADWPDSDNPCVQQWGPGPEGKTCRNCANLVAMKQSKTWYKCKLREDLTHSTRTDQRVKWPACARFEEVSK